MALLTFGISPVIRLQLRTKAELNAKTQNLLVEVLTGIQTVKAQNMEIKARWRWKERYSKYITESFKNVITSTTTSSIQQFLNQVSSLTVLCVGSFLVLKGQLTLGELIAFRIISGLLNASIIDEKNKNNFLEDKFLWITAESSDHYSYGKPFRLDLLWIELKLQIKLML